MKGMKTISEWVISHSPNWEYFVHLLHESHIVNKQLSMNSLKNFRFLGLTDTDIFRFVGNNLLLTISLLEVSFVQNVGERIWGLIKI